MIPVNQEVYGNGKGDCLRACVASVLELRINDVPNFMEYGNLWFAAFIKFIGMHGYQYEGWISEAGIEEYLSQEGIIQHPEHGAYSGFKDNHFIAQITNPQWDENDKHAVVVKQGFIVHDPHRDGSHRDDEVYCLYLIRSKTVVDLRLPATPKPSNGMTARELCRNPH